MNINCYTSKLIRKYEMHFHRENCLNSKYLILKRECEDSGLGLFAYYLTMLSWIEYACIHQMIPVIDMKNYANTYHRQGDVGIINTWELFFEQPYNIGLDEALKSRASRYVWKDIPDYHPNDSLDFLYNDSIISYYHDVAKKYIRFKPSVLHTLQSKEEEIIGPYRSKRILGVLARGTDYTNLKPYCNPIQPNMEQLVYKIDEYCEKKYCEKIYVATEDADILHCLQKKYGDKLLFTEQQRVSNITTYLYKDKGFIDRDSMERGIEYLSSIYILSKCTGLVAGRTSGTVGTCIMADNFEFSYIFSGGRYGIEDEIIKNGRTLLKS